MFNIARLVIKLKIKLIFNSMLLCVIVLDMALNLRTTESWKLRRIVGGDLGQPAPALAGSL